MNFLGFTIFDKKLKAVRLFQYPEKLKALKYYLGLTVYLRTKIHFYAKLAAFLQSLKTLLLNNALDSGLQSCIYLFKTKLSLFFCLKIISFHILQNALSCYTILVYHNPNKIY